MKYTWCPRHCQCGQSPSLTSPQNTPRNMLNVQGICTSIFGVVIQHSKIHKGLVLEMRDTHTSKDETSATLFYFAGLWIDQLEPMSTNQTINRGEFLGLWKFLVKNDISDEFYFFQKLFECLLNVSHFTWICTFINCIYIYQLFVADYAVWSVTYLPVDAFG